MRSGFWKADWLLGLAVVVADKAPVIAIHKQSIGSSRGSKAQRVRLASKARDPLVRGVSEGLVRFLERALAKHPDERSRTGEQFGAALRAASPARAAAAVEVDLEI
jgi:hypothetical protein